MTVPRPLARPADLVARRLLPRAVVASSQLDGRARAGAALRRRLGRRGRLELFFAFDDPSSAIAVLDLAARTQGRQVRLLLRPVVRRGIPGDPAVALKRRQALLDARRLQRHVGLELRRSSVLDAQDTAFLAAWVAGGPPGPALTRFCVASLSRLWDGDGPVEPEVHAELWRRHLGGAPRADAGAVRATERRMRLHGMYDTPAAWVHGQWFFAHDRPAQITGRLDALGWPEAR